MGPKNPTSSIPLYKSGALLHSLSSTKYDAANDFCMMLHMMHMSIIKYDVA